MAGGRGNIGKLKGVHDEWWKELPADWWKELGEHLETEILGRLPAEDVYRYRGVCDEWNILLSSNYFITQAWPDATVNKQPWLVVCDPLPNNPCMAFCFYTQTWKPCFSLSLPDENREVICTGSASGLVLVDRGSTSGLVMVDRGSEKNLEICNPYTGSSIQLPPNVAITPMFKCIAEDNNSAYKVVAIGFNRIVEMYHCSQQTWKILGTIPKDITLCGLSDLVCCDSSYYCITAYPRRIYGFTITTLNEGLEPTLVVPIPKPMLQNATQLQLVTCGSRLLVVAPIEEVLIISELESLNKQRHPLSTNSNTTLWAWKEIAAMPPTMWEYFKLPRKWFKWYTCTGVGDHVCFTTVYQARIVVVVYNLRTRSWSQLLDCQPMMNYCMHSLHSSMFSKMTIAFQPRLDT